MGGYEPLLLIGLHGPAVEEGRVSIDRLASLLRDIQLCVRRLGLALASETTAVAPPVSEAVLWRSCTLDVVGFDRGSMRIHLGVPNEIRKAPWPRYHGQPLAVAALDHFLDLLNRLEAGPRMVERIPTNLLTPLKRIARVFDRGISEISFSGFGAAKGVRDIKFRDTARWLSAVEAPMNGHAPILRVPGKSQKQEGSFERPSTARELVLALKGNGLVGMWKDRTDIGDTEEFARRLREQAFKRRKD
jgi:hypothetical protein